MTIFVAVTDNSWFDQLQAMARRGPLAEVNFWRPSAAPFKALSEGELLLFKLKAPRNAVAGGGFFSRAAQLPIPPAWQAFGVRNGATSEQALRERIRQIRGNAPEGPITCVILSEPFFFPQHEWIPTPPEFAISNQVGRKFQVADASGRRLYEQVRERMRQALIPDPGPAQIAVVESRFGTPRPVAPRLGQGGFRIGVLENYQRRCAISGERTLPVLEAVHIRRYSDSGLHDLRNGLLLRSDLHKLFDSGYIAVDPRARKLVVSPRIRSEFENGRDYYALAGRPLAAPACVDAAADPALLQHHFDHIYRG